MPTQYYETVMMKNNAGSIEDENAKLRQIINELDEIVKSLPNVWKDAAQIKFAEKFNQMQPELNKFCSSIDSFASKAKEHALIVEKNEGAC